MLDRRRATRSRIKGILADVLGLPIDPAEIGDDDLLFDGRLGMDSVAAIEIVTAVEGASASGSRTSGSAWPSSRASTRLAEAVEEQGGPGEA